MLPDDIIERIFDIAVEQVSQQLDLIAYNVSYDRFYKTIKASSAFPSHLMLDKMFHISPTINTDVIIKGPMSIKFHDIFNEKFYGTYEYADRNTHPCICHLEYNNDISIKDLLIKVIRHLGRHNNITKYEYGINYNCIDYISINDDEDYEDEEDTYNDTQYETDTDDETDDDIMQPAPVIPVVHKGRPSDVFVHFSEYLINYRSDDDKRHYFKKFFKKSNYIKIKD